ncbi:MAG TPA: FG-GAP-like repeat-containing protein [Lysobacter sp.]
MGALCALLALASPAAIITSVVGGGLNGQTATRVSLYSPQAVHVTADDRMYVVDSSSVRLIEPNGVIRVIAGQVGATAGFAGDGGPASGARFNYPRGIAVAPDGTVYVADAGNHRIRRISVQGIVTTIAGNGATPGPVIDGQPATQASLNFPTAVAVDGNGVLYIADTQNNCIRRLNADGTLTVIAGGGTDTSNGALATDAPMYQPDGLAFNPAGALYITEAGANRIRRLTPDGRIVTLGDYDTGVRSPRSIAVDAQGVVFYLENSQQVHALHPDGSIEHIAGDSSAPSGLYGDGADATRAALNSASGLGVDREGNLYIADSSSNRIRKVALKSAGLPNTPSRGHFLPARLISALPSRPYRLRVGNVDAGPQDDIVVLTATSGAADPLNDWSVFVLAQSASGQLSHQRIGAYPSPRSNAALELADLNGDGRREILVGGEGGLYVYEYKAAPVPRYEGRYYSRGDNIGSLAQVVVMDVNRDGYPDVVHMTAELSTNMSSRDVGYFPGSATGELRAFTVVNTSARPDGAQGFAADFNRDGVTDLAFSAQTQQLAFLYHDGRSGLLPAELWPGNSWNYLGDFDNDGQADLASTYNHYPNTLLMVNEEFIPVRDAGWAPSYVGDMDGDSRDDIVLARPDFGTVAYLQQTDLGMSDETEYAAPGVIDIDAGSFDGDRCRDIVALMTGGVHLLPGTNCRSSPASTDINGDGKSDLLWRDNAQQNLAIWQMDGGAKVAGIGFSVPPEWRVLATGDFQGDGKLDLVWTNGGAMQLWEGDGAGGFRGVQMPSYPTGWRVVASGDLNGDGNADLVWRDDSNTSVGLWVMKGAQVIDSAGYGSNPSWWVTGSGDLNGDGRLDLIWTDGANMQLWQAVPRGLGFLGKPMPAFPAGWELAAVGDTGGDGKSDLLWRYSTTGDFAVWGMDGGVRLWGAGYAPGPSWRIAQTGDFSGDGRTDIVWTNGSVMQLWQSTGTGFVGVAMPGYPTGWSVIRR